MSTPLSPDPVRDYRPEFVPAYIANGLVGLRCGRIPWRDGTAMVNGFAGLDVVDGLEGFAEPARDRRRSGFALSRCNADGIVRAVLMQRLTPDHLPMPRDADLDETAVDDAIRVAAARTRTAQDAVADEIAEEHQPDDDLTETVVDRAADLKDLAEEALDEPEAPPGGSPAKLE